MPPGICHVHIAGSKGRTMYIIQLSERHARGNGAALFVLKKGKKKDSPNLVAGGWTERKCLLRVKICFKYPLGVVTQGSCWYDYEFGTHCENEHLAATHLDFFAHRHMG